MNKLKKNILLVFVFSCSVMMSTWLAYVVAEKFFFDKFFYQKSTRHGYRVVGKDIPLTDFDERVEDMLQLWKDYENLDNRESAMVTQNNDEIYTVAVMGDSFVWGQGVVFDKTVSQLLEERLNEYRETKVLSLGIPGDSILEYLMRYDKVKQTDSVDLYIFVLVDNDLLLVNSNIEKYEQRSVFRDCRDLFPGQELVFDMAPEQYGENRTDRVNRSFSMEHSLCILDQSLKALPTDNAMYFVSQHYHDENWIPWKTYKEYLERNKKKVLYATDGKALERYKRYWKDPWKHFYVSKRDFHPSKTAHRMFAELFSNEIISNPKWNF